MRFSLNVCREGFTMPLDPILEPLLAGLPPVDLRDIDFEAFRAEELAQSDALIGQVAEAAPEVADVRGVTLPVPGGVITLKVYTPVGEGPFPAHLYLHGGGWIGGTIHSKAVDIICRERCEGAHCVVISVDYRKAPEHRFPVGLEDCYAALLWLDECADALGVRTDALTVGGGSAGGNLAAALCLMSRDRGGPALALQLLEVPALDLTLASSSITRNADGYGLTAATTRACVEFYLPDPDAAMDAYASPLFAADLSGLPPAHIMSAEFDPLCDDGERYARALEEAGVSATFSLQGGQIHISSALTAVLPAARAWRAEVLGVLRSVHSTALTG